VTVSLSDHPDIPRQRRRSWRARHHLTTAVASEPNDHGLPDLDIHRRITATVDG
jgi:hypothetical protein